MKNNPVLFLMFMVLLPGMAVAAEHQATSGEKQQFPAGNSGPTVIQQISDTNGAEFAGAPEREFKGMELGDEELGEIRAGAMDGAMPDINMPDFSKIILWDETGLKDLNPGKVGNQRGITIISWQGR